MTDRNQGRYISRTCLPSLQFRLQTVAYFSPWVEETSQKKKRRSRRKSERRRCVERYICHWLRRCTADVPHRNALSVYVTRLLLMILSIGLCSARVLAESVAGV